MHIGANQGPAPTQSAGDVYVYGWQIFNVTYHNHHSLQTNLNRCRP